MSSVDIVSLGESLGVVSVKPEVSNYCLTNVSMLVSM